MKQHAPATPAPTPETNGNTADPLKDISGFWYTEGREGGVELYPCGKDVCGRFYWLNDNAKENPSRDTHNPNPDLRDRPLCRLQFMGGFTPDGQGHYNDGWIYSPRHGAEFSASMTLANKNTLKLRGYLVFSALGETQTWTRAAAMPDCSKD